MKNKFSHRKLLVMAFDIAVLLVAAAFSAYWVHEVYPVTISTDATVRTSVLYAAITFLCIYIGGEYKKAWKLISKREYEAWKARYPDYSTISPSTGLPIIHKTPIGQTIDAVKKHTKKHNY